jgi:transcription initiation factor IIE alpha subunit
MFWKRLLAFFAPSPGPLTLAWAALIISLILSLTIAVITLSEPGFENPAILYSMVAFPPAAVMFGFATLVERRPGARVLFWTLVLLFALFSVIGVVVYGSQDPSVPFSSTILLFSICCLPFLLLLLGILIFLGWKAYPVFQRALRAARLQRVIEIIQARGEVPLENLAQELSLNVAQVEKLVCELIADGELMAYLDIEARRVYSAAALNEKQRRLLVMVATQGKAALDTLANELNVNHGLLRQWIYALVQRGQLHGFADWAAGIVYSQAVEQVLAQNICPHCGGKLDVAGKDLIACEFCGVEMFI